MTRLALVSQTINSHIGLPIYSDYLTDNYYLIHPSRAGIYNCNKLRATTHQQWFRDENNASLQTMSINGQIGETSSGVGAILFNDKNGHHSQSGTYLTYARHNIFSRNIIDLNMLSFGLNAGLIQYKLDETALLEFRPNQNNWDGTFNGQLLPESDYWFIASYLNSNGVATKFRSHFTLRH